MGELHRITNEKYLPVIEELSKYEVYPPSDNEHLPDHKQLAVKLQYSQSEMNSILKDLLKELVAEFRYPPLKVKKHVHQFLIHIPWDDYYYQLVKRKDKYERIKRWKASFRNM